MKTELLAEKTALVMQNKNGGFRDLYGSLSTVQCGECCKVLQILTAGDKIGLGPVRCTAAVQTVDTMFFTLCINV